VFVFIWKILSGAFESVYVYRVQLGKSLVFPLLVMAAIGLYEPDYESVSWSIFIAAILVEILIYTVIAITTHRIILMGPSSVPEWGIIKPSNRELIFFLYTFGIGFILSPLGILSLIPVIGVYVAFFTISYVIGRLSLVFPAIATDHGWTFSDSWKATESYQVQMMVVVVGFPFVMGVSEEYLLSFLPYSTVLVNVFSAFTLVFVVAALSVAFQVIIRERNES
jgi:hypothetical protein